MGKGRISIQDDNVTLTLKNGSKNTNNINNLREFYCLLVGSDVQANDSLCYLLRFDDDMWLIPDTTPGAIDFRRWFKQLISDDKGIVATVDYLPFTWRSVMLILPGLEANLRVLKDTEFEKIEDELSIVDDMTIEEAF